MARRQAYQYNKMWILLSTKTAALATVKEKLCIPSVPQGGGRITVSGDQPFDHRNTLCNDAALTAGERPIMANANANANANELL